jgi:mRNA interferase RelE/StbE
MGIPGKISLPDALATLVRGMHPELKSRFKLAFMMILKEPHSGKALHDELTGLRSFRVKRMRIISRVSKKGIIEVVAIGPRKRIYEETFKIISKQQ